MDLRVNRLPRIPRLPRPEEGLRVVAAKAPQAEALAACWIEQSRPVWSRAYAERRRIATASVVVLTCWLFVHVMFGANGMIVYRQKRTEYHELQKQLHQLRQENDGYTKEIDALKTDPKAIEKEAREQLHYARPGEVIYVAPLSANPVKPGNNAAKR